MDIPLLRGRFFTEADKGNAPLVAIVNRKFAQHYCPNQDPLGKRFRIGTQQLETPWLTVAGEIADVKLNSPDTDSKEQFYQPLEQVEAAIGPLGSPADINGNFGFIAFRGTLPPKTWRMFCERRFAPLTNSFR